MITHHNKRKRWTSLKMHLITYRNRNELDSTRLCCKLVGIHQHATYTLALHKMSYSVCSSKVRMVSLDFQESETINSVTLSNVIKISVECETSRFRSNLCDSQSRKKGIKDTYLCSFWIEITIN